MNDDGLTTAVQTSTSIGAGLTLAVATPFAGPPVGWQSILLLLAVILVAMLFILFDLEIVFMYPWAVVYRDAIKQSSVIFWSMLSFISILMVGYVYALRKGALDFRK